MNLNAYHLVIDPKFSTPTYPLALIEEEAARIPAGSTWEEYKTANRAGSHYRLNRADRAAIFATVNKIREIEAANLTDAAKAVLIVSALYPCAPVDHLGAGEYRNMVHFAAPGMVTGSTPRDRSDDRRGDAAYNRIMNAQERWETEVGF